MLIFILWSVLIVIILSIIGYLIIRIDLDETKPKGGIFGNSLWWLKLGRKK